MIDKKNAVYPMLRFEIIFQTITVKQGTPTIRNY